VKSALIVPPIVPSVALPLLDSNAELWSQKFWPSTLSFWKSQTMLMVDFCCKASLVFRENVMMASRNLVTRRSCAITANTVGILQSSRLQRTLWLVILMAAMSPLYTCLEPIRTDRRPSAIAFGAVVTVIRGCALLEEAASTLFLCPSIIAYCDRAARSYSMEIPSSILTRDRTTVQISQWSA
jgi:hypothetical protein